MDKEEVYAILIAAVVAVAIIMGGLIVITFIVCLFCLGSTSLIGWVIGLAMFFALFRLLVKSC